MQIKRNIALVSTANLTTACEIEGSSDNEQGQDQQPSLCCRTDGLTDGHRAVKK